MHLFTSSVLFCILQEEDELQAKGGRRKGELDPASLVTDPFIAYGLSEANYRMGLRMHGPGAVAGEVLLGRRAEDDKETGIDLLKEMDKEMEDVERAAGLFTDDDDDDDDDIMTFSFPTFLHSFVSSFSSFPFFLILTHTTLGVVNIIIAFHGLLFQSRWECWGQQIFF